MTEGMEDISAGPALPPGSASPTGSTVDTGQIPEEKPEETEAAGESGEEGAEGTAEGGGDDDGEHLGALGIVALPGTCCVCIEMERINNCLHSEKICILPILACLLSLALCTAGLKWVFVDKIFEYEPPTHLDPKRIGQDPIIISVDPTLGLTVSIPHSSPATVSLTTAITITSGHPEVIVEEKSTRGPYMPQTPRVTQSDSSVTLKYNAERPTIPKQTQSTQEFNDNIIPTISATSTTTTAKTSSHVTRCSDSQKNYCVNGGECFTLEIMPGSTKFLCRCLAGFTGHRCEQAVLKKVSDPKQAEELYQKRILTITGICIALLVVGIMCVVAYCKTKKQRKKLHDRLRQSLRNKRNNNTNTGIGTNRASSTRGRQISNLPLQDLQLNQCNGMAIQHAAEKDTETTFSTGKYALSAQEATTLTQISTQRFVSAMTSSTPLSPESRTTPATPGSPPSEMSAPLSSLAISVPSVALSPSGEEECPLLLSNTRQLHKSSIRDEQKRSSAHYNHGHVAHSLPPSPLFTMENVNYQVIGDHDTTAASQEISASPGKIIHTNNNISNCSTKRAVITNDHVPHNVVSSGDSMLVSETEEPKGEHTAFLLTDSTTALLLRAMDSSRTNPASSDDDMQVKSSSSTT
ncbi:pro-neuregulin-1, membrane-bound isoform isoform X1 [Lates calcarifer]|uniref:Pro-neuregulin-1, membrane-bound isoform isoform X1 n=1 Tax=Lates calcarifer TaxID=8187 RepID=A0AAJ8B9S8_LATCA|nr:pro-neuregulin-1, membrane-bound isoform isoform X1 [Lates calcarifer]XP_050928584.1 pro-neuregulin-1, membrane-bound isoform isoform X1 [Lates calcarifer]XP_050928585.1 pro-neuregulin-1, membrane-bound isoform isoform X1 [Lates calcarifer]